MNTTSDQATMAPIEFVALQVTVLQAAVRAIHAAHPEQKNVEEAFQQLIAQMQAQPAFLGSKANAELLRQFAEGLFQPPVML